MSDMFNNNKLQCVGIFLLIFYVSFCVIQVGQKRNVKYAEVQFCVLYCMGLVLRLSY
jgi:hypothetical protein